MVQPFLGLLLAVIDMNPEESLGWRDQGGGGRGSNGVSFAVAVEKQSQDCRIVHGISRCEVVRG